MDRWAALLVIPALAAGAPWPSPAWAQQGEAGSLARSVSAVRAQRVCFQETVQVTGAVEARDEILVRAERDGLQVSQVLVEAGDTVKSGQVLARLKQPEGSRGNADLAVEAPAAGFVFTAAALVGVSVQASGEPLFRIARDGALELSGETPVALMGRLAAGQNAKIEIIGIGELAGKVASVSTSVNPVTQLGQVAVSIAADPRVRIGAFGKATIEIARRCGPALPLSAVLYGDSGGAIVQVVRNDRIESRRVTVGLVKGDDAEIREGIAEGDLVVARAGAFVRDGDRIAPLVGRAPR